MPISRAGAPRGTPSTAAAPTDPPTVLLVTAALLAIAIGLGAGAALTRAAMRQDAIGAVRAGPWRILADAGTIDINPYLRGHYAYSGDVPLAFAQGVTALATTDDGGAPLDRRCTYRVAGPVPPALFWTLAAADRDGASFGNPAGRSGFTTDEVVRDAVGNFSIVIAREVQPGNWLPLSGTGPFALALRLYDTRLSEPAGSGPHGYPMPRIETLSCA